jgi:hypothetical protein
VLATLAPPLAQVIRDVSFSPAGAWLAAAGHRPAVQLWDLRHIGEELAARQLPWDLPPYPRRRAPRNLPRRFAWRSSGRSSLGPGIDRRLGEERCQFVFLGSN